MSARTRSIVMASGIVLLLLAIVVFFTPFPTKSSIASVGAGSCTPAGGTYNPSIPISKPCCAGLTSVLQTPGCAPGGCRYGCEKTTGSKSIKTKPARCIPLHGTYGQSTRIGCCKGLAGVILTPKCKPGKCRYSCEQSGG